MCIRDRFASVQENDGLYQPVYEVAGLPGAGYDGIADEDIYTGDGTWRVEKDTVGETLTTGEDGSAKSGLLYLCLLYTSKPGNRQKMPQSQQRGSASVLSMRSNGTL